jgi:hypothetical protein
MGKYLAKDLRYRIQIKTPIQTPDSSTDATENLEVELTYTTVATIWGDIRTDSKWVEALRGVQDNERETLEIKVRHSAIYAFGSQYASAFSTSFDESRDMNPLKRDFFCFIENDGAYKGKLYRITGIKKDNYNKRFFLIRVVEEEEQGTGYY